MTIEIQEVTNEEFEAVRPHFEVKAMALGKTRRFVHENGEWVDKSVKDWLWTGYDKKIIDASNLITTAPDRYYWHGDSCFFSNHTHTGQERLDCFYAD